MQNGSLVSVIIPIYNCEKYIEECLESVINQSYKNIEIICIDDASTDSSALSLKKYINFDPRIKVLVNSKNIGLAESRNVGIKHATGKYVYFLDSDDYITRNAMKDLVEIADSNETDCILFNSKMVNETTYSSAFIDFDMPEIDGSILKGEELFVRVMKKYGTFPNSVWRQFWKREFILDHELYFDGRQKTSEDFPFTMKSLLQCKKVVLLNRYYHCWRKHEGSMSLTDSGTKVIYLFMGLCSVIELLKNEYGQDAIFYLRKRIDSYWNSIMNIFVKYKYEVHKDLLTNPYESLLFDLMFEKQDSYALNISENALIKLNNANKIFIYGDGRTAGKVLYSLEKKGFSIDGIVVSDSCKNGCYFRDILVSDIDEIDFDDRNDIVVLGIIKSERNSVMQLLEKKGYRSIIEIDDREGMNGYSKV